MSAPITHLLLPCRHAHFCRECVGLILVGAVSDPPECPLCRNEINDIEEAQQEVEEQRPERIDAYNQVIVFSSMLKQSSLAMDSQAQITTQRVRWTPISTFVQMSQAMSATLGEALSSLTQVGSSPNEGMTSLSSAFLP